MNHQGDQINHRGGRRLDEDGRKELIELVTSQRQSAKDAPQHIVKGKRTIRA